MCFAAETGVLNQCNRVMHLCQKIRPEAECNGHLPSVPRADMSRAERIRRRLHFLHAHSCNLSVASVPTAISNIFYGPDVMG